MRLWSLHPHYLDVKGLTAVWREALLAQKVLQGATRGYRNHPQLQRFRQQPDPLAAIAAYLDAVWQDAASRGYAFDRTKIPPHPPAAPIPVTRGQLAFEWQHLLAKLARRDPPRWEVLRGLAAPEPHPLFVVVPGGEGRVACHLAPLDAFFQCL